jgi:hypothetical protein
LLALTADFSPRVFDMEGHGYSSLHLSIRDRFIAACRQHDFAGSGTLTGDIPVARTNGFWTAAVFIAFTQKALFFEFLCV